MSESQSSDSPQPETDPLVGMELGNYKIIELIGEGGMGAVYAARHPVLGREVAVKVLSRKFCDEEDFLARFRQEALAANRVGHEVIVEATDFGELPDGRSYYVMDRLHGESLGVMMDRRGAIPLTETAELILPVMDALQAAHDSGVIHRDLKPDNIFLQQGRGGRIQPKLLDFGLAKMLEVDHTGTGVTTQTGLLLGTPLYMPPEQFSGKPETLGPWTDVYALAGVIFHMLAAKPPYDEHGFADLLMKHMQAPIPSICDRKADIPQALDDALRLALAKKPAERFQNMQAFREAFEAAARTATDLGVSATIRPTDSMDLFPRARPRSADVVTVAAHTDPAETVAAEEPELQARTALPEPEPAPAPEPEPDLTATAPAKALRFDDERPGASPRPRPRETPGDKATVAAKIQPKQEPTDAARAASDLPPPAAKRGAGGTVLLVLALLAATGGGGYAAWAYLHPGESGPKRGTLVVDAQPPGSLVRIDNEEQWAPSPVTRKLTVGSHKVTIKKPGFDQNVSWVSIRPGKQRSVAIDLLPSSRPAPTTDGEPTPGMEPPGMESPDGDPRPTVMDAMSPGANPGKRHRRPPRRTPGEPRIRRRRPPPPDTAMVDPGMATNLSALLAKPPNIGRAIARVYPGLKACFFKAKPGSAVLKRRLRVSLRVGTNGRPSYVRVSPGALGGTPTGRCIRAKVKSWKLPPYPNPYSYAFSIQFAKR